MGEFHLVSKCDISINHWGKNLDTQSKSRHLSPKRIQFHIWICEEELGSSLTYILPIDVLAHICVACSCTENCLCGLEAFVLSLSLSLAAAPEFHKHSITSLWTWCTIQLLHPWRADMWGGNCHISLACGCSLARSLQNNEWGVCSGLWSLVLGKGSALTLTFSC